MNARPSRKAIAFHEAAHAVARLHVGAPATAVRIVGGGYTHGSRRWPGRGQERIWKWLLVLFAGSYAQAFMSRRSFARTIKTFGKLDLKEAARAIRWLVQRGYARNSLLALERVHWETFAFLALRWDAIERVADALHERGRLTARQVRSLAELN